MTLDKRLWWKDHITDKIKKVKNLLMATAHLTKEYWGPRPKLLRWAWTGIVRPVLSYAAVTWAHEIDNPTIKKMLRKLNRLALLTIAKVPKSTPTRALEIILGVPPLQLHLYKEALAAHSRIFHHETLEWEGVYKNLTHSVSHLKFWELLRRDAGMETAEQVTDKCDIHVYSKRFIVDGESFVNMAERQNRLDCNVFTDGSKKDDKIGAGYHIQLQNGLILNDYFRLSDHATVFQAEIFAITEAANALCKLEDPGKIKIFVDSQSALQALQSDSITSRMVLDACLALNNIHSTHNRTTTLVWTKAHVGTEGNERADELAKLGTELDYLVDTYKPFKDEKLELKEAITKMWNVEWGNYKGARQTKIFHPEYDVDKSKTIISWNRLQVGRYIRAVTGHNNLLYHLHNMDSKISPICRYCLDACEEFQHLAFNCPALWEERHKIDAMTTDQSQWTCRQILDFTMIPKISEAFEKPLFLCDTFGEDNMESGDTQQHPPFQSQFDPDDPRATDVLDTEMQSDGEESESNPDSDISVPTEEDVSDDMEEDECPNNE